MTLPASKHVLFRMAYQLFFLSIPFGKRVVLQKIRLEFVCVLCLFCSASLYRHLKAYCLLSGSTEVRLQHLDDCSEKSALCLSRMTQ